MWQNGFGSFRIPKEVRVAAVFEHCAAESCAFSLSMNERRPSRTTTTMTADQFSSLTYVTWVISCQCLIENAVDIVWPGGSYLASHNPQWGTVGRNDSWFSVTNSRAWKRIFRTWLRSTLNKTTFIGPGGETKQRNFTDKKLFSWMEGGREGGGREGGREGRTDGRTDGRESLKETERDTEGGREQGRRGN